MNQSQISSGPDKPAINLQEITNENRAGLVKRWNSAQKPGGIEETMHRYGMSRSQVEKLASLTFEQLEMCAGVGYSLFTLNCDERVFDLAKQTESSVELARIMVLRGH